MWLYGIFDWFTSNKTGRIVGLVLGGFIIVWMRDRWRDSKIRADEARRAEDRFRKAQERVAEQAREQIKESIDEQEKITERAADARVEAEKRIADAGGWTDADSVPDPIAREILFGDGPAPHRTGRGRRGG